MQTSLINENITPLVIHNKIKDTVNPIKVWCKSGLLYVVAGVIFKGLSELALSQPSATVVLVTSKSLSYAVIGSTILAAVSFIRALNKAHADISSKRVALVTIPKDEFDAMKAEIQRLRLVESQTLQ